MSIKNDPTLYARMCEEHPTREAAVDAPESFMADVQAAREKHRIRDVVVVSVAACPKDKESGAVIITAAFGDSNISAQLGAVAYQRFTKPVIAQAAALERLAKGDERP